MPTVPTGDEKISITTTTAEGKTPTRYWNNDLRAYTDGTITISTIDGYVIESVMFKGTVKLSVDSKTVSAGAPFEVNGQSVTFKVTGTCKITDIEIIYSTAQ